MAIKVCLFLFFVAVLMVSLCEAKVAGRATKYNAASARASKSKAAKEKNTNEALETTVSPVDKTNDDEKILESASEPLSSVAGADILPKEKDPPILSNAFKDIGSKVSNIGKKISEEIQSVVNKVNETIYPKLHPKNNERPISNLDNDKDNGKKKDNIVGAPSPSSGGNKDTISYMVIPNEDSKPEPKSKDQKQLDEDTVVGSAQMTNHVQSLRKQMESFQRSMDQRYRDSLVGASNPEESDENQENKEQPKVDPNVDLVDNGRSFDPKKKKLVTVKTEVKKINTKPQIEVYKTSYSNQMVGKPKPMMQQQQMHNFGSFYNPYNFNPYYQQFAQFKPQLQTPYFPHDPYRMYFGGGGGFPPLPYFPPSMPNYPQLAKRSIKNKQVESSLNNKNNIKRSSGSENVWGATSEVFDSLVKTVPQVSGNVAKEALPTGKASELLESSGKILTQAYDYASKLPQMMKIPSLSPNEDIFLSVLQNPEEVVGNPKEVVDNLKHEAFKQLHPVGSVLQSANKFVKGMENNMETVADGLKKKITNPTAMVDHATNFASSLVGSVANTKNIPGLVDESGSVLKPAIGMVGKMVGSVVQSASGKSYEPMVGSALNIANAATNVAGVPMKQLDQRLMSFQQYYPSMLPLSAYYPYAGRLYPPRVY